MHVVILAVADQQDRNTEQIFWRLRLMINVAALASPSVCHVLAHLNCPQRVVALPSFFCPSRPCIIKFQVSLS